MEALTSGYPQDPKKACLTELSAFKNVSHKGSLGV